MWEHRRETHPSKQWRSRKTGFSKSETGSAQWRSARFRYEYLAGQTVCFVVLEDGL